MLRYIRYILIISLISAHAFPIPSHAASESSFSKIKKTQDPVTVKGDKVEYFHDQHKIQGTGNVSIVYGDIKLTCDTITVFTDTKEAICEGNVKIVQPGATMEGEKINYSFSEKKGYALESKIKAKPFYGQAGKLEQLNDREFEIKNGYITTCDKEKPHYRIEAKQINFFMDDKVVARHIFVYVGKVPILYLPIYVQPIIENRPEVTIVPGRSGDWGYYALTAWRYYFDENNKGHIHIDYREKRGLAQGIDYKYKTKEMGHGLVRFYYAHENDDLTLYKTRSIDDRWRIQYRHNMNLPEDTVLNFEFNKLSDKEIIKDYLYEEHKGIPNPDNYILFKTTKPNYIFTFLMRKRFNEFFEVVERLPEAKLEVNNQRLWDTNFYYSSNNSATYFVKRFNNYYTDDIRSSRESLRLDNYHKLSYASKLFKFLFVNPFIATRQTLYSRNRWKDQENIRSIYEYGFDVSTKFYKIFDTKSDLLDVNRLRHIITPSLGFLSRHQPTIAPENLYQFDSIDSITDSNGFTMALENKLQTKRPSSGDQMKTVDLATLIVSTNYLFKLKKRSLEPQGIGRFGDVKFELELKPHQWLFIDSDMTLDRQDLDINSANIDVYVDMDDKFSLGLGHRYEHTSTDRTSQLTFQTGYKVNDEWKIKMYQRFDFDEGAWEEQEYAILKDLHCWLAEFTFNIRDRGSSTDFSAWLVFRLKAFPKTPIGLFKTTYHRPQPGGRW